MATKDLFGKPIPVEFEEFWQAYCRKDGKQDALKAWMQITVKAKIPPARIIAGAKLYAQYCQTIERRYWKTPAPWLRSFGFDDESIQPKPTKPLGDAQDRLQEAFSKEWKWEKTEFGMRKVRVAD